MRFITRGEAFLSAGCQQRFPHPSSRRTTAPRPAASLSRA